MYSLADQLIPILPPAAREQYRKCTRKQEYGSIAEATAVALKRHKAGAGELYVYPCPYDESKHFHLTSMRPTPMQIEALETFSAKSYREAELEGRRLRQEMRALDIQVRATRSQFRRRLEEGCIGTPFHSRITAHYEGLRVLIGRWNDLRLDYLRSAFVHDAKNHRDDAVSIV